MAILSTTYLTASLLQQSKPKRKTSILFAIKKRFDCFFIPAKLVSIKSLSFYCLGIECRNKRRTIKPVWAAQNLLLIGIKNEIF